VAPLPRPVLRVITEEMQKESQAFDSRTALVLTGWAACSSSSNNNPDVAHFGGAGGTCEQRGADWRWWRHGWRWNDWRGGSTGSGGATETAALRQWRRDPGGGSTGTAGLAALSLWPMPG